MAKILSPECFAVNEHHGVETGTCNENVVIADLRSLMIVAGAGGAKIVAPQDFDAFDIVRSQLISLVNLEIAGVPGSTPASAGVGVFIGQASNVADQRVRHS